MLRIDGLTIVPILHGRAAFSAVIRKLCNTEKFDCIAVDLPKPFCSELFEAVSELPFISAVTAHRMGEESLYYIPTDPCDASIEAIRQAQQKRLPCHCIGHPEIHAPLPLPSLPDEHAITTLGFDAYATLCLHALHDVPAHPAIDRITQYSAFQLHTLRASHTNILALIHFSRILPLINHFRQERTYNLSFEKPVEYTIENYFINPDHLYFACGELPFITGIMEKERYDILAEPLDITECIKEMFRKTRDDYFSGKDRIIDLSPTRLQNGLTFLRNMTLLEKRFIPSLFDIVAAAKGIGGNSYAIRILECVKYYPYLPFDQAKPVIAVGIDKVQRPGHTDPDRAVNLLRDTQFEWKSLSIKPDPSELRKKKYRYLWNPHGMCSHIPEDAFIEHFNTHVRSKASKALSEDLIKTERFETSVKDGIDIRETLRNWHTGGIYVKELPPSRGAVDTVVIIFDENHDDRYPHHTTWYAEHEEESTLTFFGTNPFDDMIGPGIARCTYGGVSLLFPPRAVPDIFTLPAAEGMKKLSYTLVYGALLFSREASIAYIAVKRPDIFMKQCAARFKKRLIWIPLSAFSAETLRKLRRFHVLNGKQIRSWASRFIGE